MALLVGCAALVGAGLAAEPAQATVYVAQMGNGPGEYTYTVPAGLTSLTVVLVGGAGGSLPESQDPLWEGGTGAFLQGTFAVTPGEQLSVVIGGQGGADGSGGFGGGGDGASGLHLSGAGGEARRASASTVSLSWSQPEAAAPPTATTAAGRGKPPTRWGLQTTDNLARPAA